MLAFKLSMFATILITTEVRYLLRYKGGEDGLLGKGKEKALL